jgi:hypothetical protein
LRFRFRPARVTMRAQGQSLPSRPLIPALPLLLLASLLLRPSPSTFVAGDKILRAPQAD